MHAHTSTANCPLGVLSRCEMPACPLSTPVQPCRSHAPACVSHCGPPAESLPLWPGQACPGMPRVPITLGPAPGIVTAWDSANGHAHGPLSPAALDRIAGAVGYVCVRGELLGAYASASAGSSEARRDAQVPTTPCSALRPLRMPLAPRPWSAQAAACCLPHTVWRPSRSASAWLCAAPARPCAAPATRLTAPAQRCSSPRAARCTPRRLARRQQRTYAHEGRALTQHCAPQELDAPIASGAPALQVACCPCRQLRSCRRAGARHACLALTAP